MKNQQIKKDHMNNMNHVQLIGRLGTNPQVKNLDNGRKVASFSIAVENNYTNKTGEKITEVQWHRVNAWNGLADVASSILRKGRQVTVSGKLLVKKIQPSTGQARLATSILASKLQLQKIAAA
jgi:single-strand DNA-binding protein